MSVLQFQEISRCENHIEIGLGKKDGLFQGVSQPLIASQYAENSGKESLMIVNAVAKGKRLSPFQHALPLS